MQSARNCLTIAVLALAAAAGKAEAQIGGIRFDRQWKIFIVQHSHTDMGYTDYPSRLAADHLDFIEEALRACDLTDSYPEDARFRWTCEGTWAVERFLRERPRALVQRFLERAAQGRIEVTAMSMNMTDLATEEGVFRSFYPVARLRARGIPIRSAMQCDVNGYPWALPEIFADLGIRGFVGAINVTRSTLPFEFPRAISWQSPSGGSVLAWRGEHYMEANFLGFQESVETVLSRLPSYLSRLEARGYPYDAVLLQMSGYYTDNAAPSHRVCDLVRTWNERFSNPKLRVATLSEFFDALGERPDAPSFRKAWPDWWADGVGSAALETALIREAQERMEFAEVFLAAARALRDDVPNFRETFEEAYLRARLYDEHTFGAAESIERPFSLNTKVQWGEKAANAYWAGLRATELASAALRSLAPRLVGRGEIGLVVFNSLSWERSGPLAVRLPRSLLDGDAPFRIVNPESGREVPYQLVREAPNYREIELVAERVPPVGYRVYRVVPGEAPAPPGDPFAVKGTKISNGIVEATLDPARCAIASIAPRGGENLVGAVGEHAFGQLVYERLIHEKGQFYLWPAPEEYDPSVFRREVPSAGEVAPGAGGPVRRSLVLRGSLKVPEGEMKIETEVSLYRDLPGVSIENRLEKPEVLKPESAYFAFPFAAASRPRAELVGGVAEPGADQIPGSATDWHAIQRFVRFSGGGRDAVWVSRDVPLVQFGGLNVGRYGRGVDLERPLVYSWALNNYWFTNFLASQRGAFVFRYAILPGSALPQGAAEGGAADSDAAAHRFAREVCSPLQGALVSGEAETPPAKRSFLTVEPRRVCMVSAKEAEGPGPFGLVVRLRNFSGEAAEAVVRPMLGRAPKAAYRASCVEEPRESLPIEGGAARLRLGPWELATLLFRWE